MSHLTLLPQPEDASDSDAVPRREHVVAVLTDGILNHRLLPGQRLVEREIIEQLGVSRATVREAFRQLAADGLVQMQPQRGASVMSASAAGRAGPLRRPRRARGAPRRTVRRDRRTRRRSTG